jgi:ribosomal protein S18 acetylase RimI-like enzyme
MRTSFRLAELADAPALAALIERAYRGEEAGEGWASEARLLKGPRTSLAEITALLSDADGRFVIAEDGGVLAGCALIQKRAASPCHSGEARAGEAYFGMFAISPDAQGAGLGKAVLAEAERQARALWGARAMVMTVINVRDELIAWYERRGYARSGARHPFPFSATSGEVTREFDLVELRKALGG